MIRAMCMVGAVVMVSFIARPAASEDGKPPDAAMPFPLKVVGTQILNSRGNASGSAASTPPASNGRATARAHPRDGEDGHRRLARQHHSPAAGAGPLVRQGPEQTDEGRPIARSSSRSSTSAWQGCYIILDLHWSDAASGASRSASTRCPTGTA